MLTPRRADAIVHVVRALGLDVGSKTIGVAISDELGLAAHPVRTIQRRGMGPDAASVLELVREREVDLLVVGMPYDLAGRIGPRAERVVAFIEQLRAAGAPPIETWDERFSTVEAERGLLEADLSRRKRKRVIDQAAAMVILQGWLDGRRQGRE
jgi:putative holliday junction resolvase